MLPSTILDVAPCRPGADERSFWWPRIQCVRHGKVAQARGQHRAPAATRQILSSGPLPGNSGRLGWQKSASIYENCHNWKFFACS